MEFVEQEVEEDCSEEETPGKTQGIFVDFSRNMMDVSMDIHHGNSSITAHLGWYDHQGVDGQSYSKILRYPTPQMGELHIKIKVTIGLTVQSFTHPR